MAGHETTAATLIVVLIFLIKHPECQKRIHEELDSVVGSDRYITMDDKPKLHYVNAYIQVRVGIIEGGRGGRRKGEGRHKVMPYFQAIKGYYLHTWQGRGASLLPPPPPTNHAKWPLQKNQLCNHAREPYLLLPPLADAPLPPSPTMQEFPCSLPPPPCPCMITSPNSIF